MFNQNNFILELSNNSSDILIGKNINLKFNIKNIDTVVDLYNITLEITLPSGIEFVTASEDVTSISNNVYSFVNIKDLAANEVDFTFSVEVNLNMTYPNGNAVLGGDQFQIGASAFADTMPRGNYDTNNEIVSKSLEVSGEAISYSIVQGPITEVLLGESNYFEVIIETSEASQLILDNLQIDIGNGLEFTGNIQFTGYSSSELNSYTVVDPSTNNNYEIIWSTITIPQNTNLTISYELIGNERYYVNGISNGSLIKQNDQVQMQIHYKILGKDYYIRYMISYLEFMISLIVSKYTVDINNLVNYLVKVKINSYNALTNLIVYLTTSDGQVLANTSTPMYTTKTISEAGVTQVNFEAITLNAGSEVDLSINGNIGTEYLETGIGIYAGDTFTVSTSYEITSSVSHGILTGSDSASLSVDVPTISKVITGYYYNDLTPKTYNTLAPGDFIGYKITYNSLNVNAPSNSVKIFDFYPYGTKDIANIQYSYSNPNYPNTSVVTVEPNGVFWFVSQIAGGISFDIDFKVQIIYQNSLNYFNNNLAKMQLANSNNISVSSRGQVPYNIGKPNIVITKEVTGTNISKIKIGEIYNVSVNISNILSDMLITDAYNMIFTESIDSGVTLDESSVMITSPYGIIPTVIGNTISFNIDKLGVSSNIELNYSISVDDTLAPNEKFKLTSNLTSPYSQEYVSGQGNIIYNLGPYNLVKTLTSEDISITLTSDKSSYVVGNVAQYGLNINVPEGVRLASLYGLILIPGTDTFTGEAYLNGSQITASEVSSTVIFPAISNIDTTTGAIRYNYSINSNITNSIVNVSNPYQTVQSIYGNANYNTINNNSINKGISSNINIQHPVITLTLGSSSINSNFVQAYQATLNTVYTQIRIQNTSSIDSKNITVTITMPEELEFVSSNIQSQEVSYSYDSNTRILTVMFAAISASSEEYFVFKSSIVNNQVSSSATIISGIISRYYNLVSTTKMYSSHTLTNSTLYLKSRFSFLPLSFYAIPGSQAAINLSKPGVETRISYIVTNLGQGIESITLSATTISYPYDIYVGNNFIQSVAENTGVNLNTEYLQNINTGDSRYISFVYTIPVTPGTLYYDTTKVTATSVNDVTNFKTIPTTLQDP